MTEIPLGRSIYKPLFDALVRHGLPLGIHAGSMFRNPASQSGFYSTFSEDYAAHISAFTAQVASLISEGIFTEYPDLKVVLIESGVTWLPPFMWRFTKTWRGVRNEVPWVTAPAGRHHARSLASDDAALRRPAARRSGQDHPADRRPATCCCSPPTIRTGTSTAMPRSRPACRRS